MRASHFGWYHAAWRVMASRAGMSARRTTSESSATATARITPISFGASGLLKRELEECGHVRLAGQAVDECDELVGGRRGDEPADDGTELGFDGFAAAGIAGVPAESVLGAGQGAPVVEGDIDPRAQQGSAGPEVMRIGHDLVDDGRDV